MKSIEPTSHMVKVRDINMHYVDWGGNGPPVLCVHGLSSHCRSWDSLAKVLHPRYRVLAVDLRGRGNTDKPPAGYGYDSHAQDVDALMSAIGLEKAAYAGHSMGANLGVYFAAHYQRRVSKLILVDGGGADRPQYVMDSLKVALQRLDMKWPSVEAYLDYWRPAVFFKDWNEYIERYLRFDARQNPDGSFSSKASKVAVEQDTLSRFETDFRSCYPRIACPTLVFKAEYGILTKTDWVLPQAAAQEMVKSIRQCELVEIKGVNHYTILLSKNRQLQDKVLQFLSS